MKKILAALTVLVVLAAAVPTFAAVKETKCPTCYGSGKCFTCRGTGKIVAYNWARDKKGKKVRIPPYYKACYICFGKGRCRNCQGKGTKKIYIPG
ncbi:MAG: hypothetical protein IKI08_01820 [Selenomonadaceae bacterium]|nr:hypothetical protein [Selenomonadaceae bacterium]